MQNWFVVVMGIGTVFVVLVLIIGLCWLLGKLLADKKGTELPAAQPVAVQQTADAIPNRPVFIAAVSAAIAEASGTDASAIRILSVKKI